MKRTFRMQHLDCANCAAKMERAIAKIDGVETATVSFMTQRLSITAQEEDFAQIMPQVQAVCKKVEPHCKIQDF